MSYTLIFNSRAENEYVSARLWYEEQVPGLGERFEQEIEKKLQKITFNPFA